MKKAFFAVITIFLSLALFSCLFTAPDNTGVKPVQYTEDGRPLVELTIGSSAVSRALTTELAKAGVNYYEVVFYGGGTDYYRTAWHKVQGNGKLIVPVDVYQSPALASPGTPSAVLFAGTYEDKTLLATGIISTPTGGNITASTTAVTFTLTALRSDINAATFGDSSFKITGPAPYVPISTDPIPTLSAGDHTYPVFRVPANISDSSITATFTIGGITNTREAIAYNAPAGSAPLQSMAFSSQYITNSGMPLDLGLVFYDIPTPASPPTSILGSGGILNIKINTMPLVSPNERGYGLLCIQVPVNAFAPTVPGGITWYIRGGIGNFSPDAGAAAQSIGGAILLCAVDSDSISISVTGL